MKKIELDKLAETLLPVQQKTKPYVTVRDAQEALKRAGIKMSIGTVFHALRSMVLNDMAEQVGSGHYHIKETE